VRYDVCLLACGNVQASAWKASDKNKAWRNPPGQKYTNGFVDFGSLAILSLLGGPNIAFGPLRKIKTHGFASPPLDGFAFIVFL